MMDLTNLNVSAKQDSMEQPAEEKVSCWSLNSGLTESFPNKAKNMQHHRGILSITKFVLKLKLFPLKHTLVLQWNKK